MTSSSSRTVPKPSPRRVPIRRLLMLMVSWWVPQSEGEGAVSVAGAPHEAGDVEDQRNAAVTHDRRARDVVDPAVVRLQVLDDDLLLAEQLVDQQADPAAFGLGDDHDAADVLEVESRHAEHTFELEHRHEL